MTLPELLVVCVMFMVLTGVVYALFRYQSQTFNRESAKAMTQGDLRLWLGRMANDLRRANYDPTGVNPTTNRFTLQTFTPTELTFTSDFDADGVVDTDPAETLGYRLNTASGTLELVQNGAARTVLRGVVGSDLFTYQDGSGTTFVPDGTVASRRSIAAVTMTLAAQSATGGSPGVAPPMIEETVSVGFRNLVY
jgi:type II secretory pathway component PulJ